ncbi:hypothetical protein NK8_83980 (plasmid) [Caballeronia sp. NK8]|nr:hypothetical protein NK8_83980 [Caballeronia sp. NK8]
MLTPSPTDRSRDIADRVEAFVRETVIPFECDSRNGPHGPSEELVTELRTLARAQG